MRLTRQLKCTMSDDNPTKMLWHFYTCVLPYWRKPSRFWFMLKKWARWHAYRWDPVGEKWVRRKIWICKPNPPNAMK